MSDRVRGCRIGAEIVLAAPKEIYVMNTAALKKPTLESGRNSFEIRIARTEAEKREIYQFRYRIYFEQMGRDKKYANHFTRTCSDPADETAVHIAAYSKIDGSVIGVARINFWSDGEFLEDELYHFTDYLDEYDSNISLTSKMMIDPEWRGSLMFLELCKKLYHVTASRGCRLNFIATADELVPLFSRLGFSAHRPRTTWADYGSSNPMILRLDDIDELERVRSPFASLAARYFPSVAERREKHFPLSPRIQFAVV